MNYPQILIITLLFISVLIPSTANAQFHKHDGIPEHFHGTKGYYQMVFKAGVKTQTPPRWHYHTDGGDGEPVLDNIKPSPPSTPTPTRSESTPQPSQREESENAPTPTPTRSEPIPQPSQTTPEPSAPIKIPVADPKRILATEWMLRDLGRSVPQWIEIWNNNSVAIDLKGWSFEYATRKFRNAPYKIHKVVLTEFNLPANEAIIFATHKARESTIPPGKVYLLNIGYVLKQGWRLTTANGTVVHAIGEAFTEEKDQRPREGTLRGTWRDQIRVSYQHYKSSVPEMQLRYGHKNDIGSPTHYESIRNAPPQLRPKRIRTWATLKQL